MSFEDIMLSHRRVNTAWFHLHEVPKIAKLTEAKRRMVIARGREEEEEWGVKVQQVKSFG